MHKATPCRHKATHSNIREAISLRIANHASMGPYFQLNAAVTGSRPLRTSSHPSSMARPTNLLATPADLGWLVRPGPDYEIEDDDEDGILFKFGRMVAPTDEEIIDWLRAGTSGDCGGEETEG